MSDSTIRAIPPLVQIELEMLRDQRDLYHSLLLAEPVALASFMSQALATAERLRSTLRMPTRDGTAFRGKIERLQMELTGLGEAGIGLHLPTVMSRLTSAQAALRDIEARAEITGNDLLPAMVSLEELCSHLAVAADCASVHVPLAEEDSGSYEMDVTGHRAQQPKLAAGLQQLVEKSAAEHGKRATLVTMGLEEIPESWISTLFDALGQLLRNAIEHGIETATERAARSKPESGTLVVEFVERGAKGFELNVQDDGAGLDTERIAEVAVRRGLLTSEAAQTMDGPRMASLIFQPGLTTARDESRRGNGMQIVRDHVHRLGGRINVAAKRGQFTRFRITLPVSAETHVSSHPRA